MNPVTFRPNKRVYDILQRLKREDENLSTYICNAISSYEDYSFQEIWSTHETYFPPIKGGKDVQNYKSLSCLSIREVAMFYKVAEEQGLKRLKFDLDGETFVTFAPNEELGVYAYNQYMTGEKPPKIQFDPRNKTIKIISYERKR